MHFRHMILNEVKKLWQYGPVLPDKAEAVVYTTIEALQRRAYERVRRAFVTALGVEKKYQWDPTLKTAIDQLTTIAVAGVFGEIPLTEKEKNDKLQSLHYALDAMDIYKQAQKLDPWPGETYKQEFPPDSPWSSVVQMAKQKPVTKDEIVEAMKAMKGGKSGLPAAKYEHHTLPAHAKPAKDEDEALAQLWSKVEKKSDELLGIKQDAKKNELMGLDPEEV